MTKYIDGFLIAIPQDKVKEYQKMSRKAGKLWMKYGALDYVETVADEIDGKDFAPFSKAAKCKPGETVVFSWISYKSKAHRNKVNAAVMADPKIKEMCPGSNPDLEMPFDVKRMHYGGFKVIVQG